MSRLKYNNALGVLGASLTNVGTTITFAVAPSFATLVAPDYIPLALEPASTAAPSANFEIVHLTAYTAGQTTGTIVRGQELTSGVSHANGVTWVCSPLTNDTPIHGALVNTYTGLTTGTEMAETMALPGRASVLHRVDVDQPCRFRIYATQALATADISRAQTVDPGANSGCLLELVFTGAGSQTYYLSPEIFAVEQDTTPSSTFYANVRCDNGTTLNVTLHGYALEP